MLDRAIGDLVIEAARDEGEKIVAQIVEAGVNSIKTPTPALNA
jgi:hypothetical protein